MNNDFSKKFHELKMIANEKCTCNISLECRRCKAIQDLSDLDTIVREMLETIESDYTPKEEIVCHI